MNTDLFLMPPLFVACKHGSGVRKVDCVRIIKNEKGFLVNISS